jgi:hypothetical protein
MHPYAEACRRLAQARVPYVIVGVFGVNLYSERVGTVITTADCDFLLPADAAILSRALRALAGLGYAFEAGREPFLPDPELLQGVVRARANIVARREDTQLDLVLEIAGCRYEDLWKRRRRFRVDDVLVRVAPLQDILRSKELAGRPKDRLFLETYRDALDNLLRSDRG